MSTQRDQSGFSLLELLIAIAVFAIVVPALMGFLNVLSIINDRARDVAVINTLVENKVEELRSRGYIAINNGTVDFTDELPTDIAGSRSAEYVVTTLEAGLKQVDLTVTYNDHGKENVLTYRTYVGGLGVGQY